MERVRRSEGGRGQTGLLIGVMRCISPLTRSSMRADLPCLLCHLEKPPAQSHCCRPAGTSAHLTQNTPTVKHGRCWCYRDQFHTTSLNCHLHNDHGHRTGNHLVHLKDSVRLSLTLSSTQDRHNRKNTY